MNAEELYEQAIKPLPPGVQLRLASLILNGIPSDTIVDFRDDWSDEDMRDAALHSYERAARSFEEDETDD